ncbi:MAG: AfsR/SARP family transcriptional regulator [Candidatus Limnocylindrales bacterium]
MDVPTMLEVAAQALSALLAVWLAFTVVTRSGSPVARVFILLALVLATWSSCIIVQRLTTPADASTAARAVEELMAALALGGLAHFALVVAADGHPSRRQLAATALGYGVLVAFAVPGMLDRQMPVGITPPHVALGPIPGAVLGWAWVAARLATISLGAAWVLAAMRAPGSGTLRRRQLRAALATIVMAGFGASLRFLPVIGDADRWIGTSFITLAVVCATYAVFAGGIFFGPAVAARAFRTSVTGGLVVVGLVVVLVGIDVLSRAWLGLDVPYFSLLGLIVAAALYGPLASRFGGRLMGGNPRTIARERLLRALGEPALAVQPSEAGVHPALARLARALDVTGLAIIAPDGSLVVSEGSPPTSGPVPPIPLLAGGELVGELRVGESATGASLNARDLRLLELTAAYVARALQTGRREDEQTADLASLAEARALVESQAAELHAALVERGDVPTGVRVFALGPLRVEREGSRIEHWGGDKAGSRQAQALFAFLYDRGERGLAKDEVLELVWPDIDLERADLAFHRTMGGLRSTLDPDHRSGNRTAVRFANDRYRLGDSVVAWSDVDAFLAALGRAAADPADRIRSLEEARRLYRGEYLDDCPYYGDSAFVEDRRALLRTRFVDLVVALGETYESGGDRMSAAAAFREAIMRAPDGCPPAAAGLARLGL